MASVSHRGTFASGDPGIGPEGPVGPQGPQGPAGDGSVWVEEYGAVGDGVTDDAAAFQAAIDANPGRLLKGRGNTAYIIGSTLSVTTRGFAFEGETDLRKTSNGTELTFTGSGSLIEIGADDGQPHDANLYNGPQDTWLRRVHLRAATTATPLTMDATKLYKAGTYGIRDWRGGGIRLEDVSIEGFEYAFWGINSDINEFRNVGVYYSKYGLYLGPRSDQFLCTGLYAFYCDQVFDGDRITGATLADWRLVECGHSASSDIVVRKGCGAIRIIRPWLESLQFGGSNKAGWISAGLVDGYDGVTTPVAGLTVEQPTVYTTASGGTGHRRSVIDLGAAVAVVLDQPGGLAGVSVANVDALVLAPTGTAFTNSEAIATVTGVSSGLTAAQVYTNSGTGTPNVDAVLNGPSGLLTRQYRGASAAVTTVNLTKSVSYSATIPPVTGTAVQGDIVWNSAGGVGTPVGAYCVVAGSPGTWRVFGDIAGTPTNTHKSADYTVLTSDRVLILRGASAPVTFTLPATPLDGQRIEFANHDSADALTIARNGRNINDAGSNLTLTPGTRTTLYYITSTTSWYTVG